MGKEVMGHWKKLVSDPKYIGEADFEDSEEKVVTIELVTCDLVINKDGRAEKTVLNFKENCKPLILNVTNSKAISKVTGKKKVEEWKGARIVLYIDPHVKAFGDIVSAVRVRPFAPKPTVQQKPEDIIKCQECGNNIKPYSTMTVATLAQHTKAKYGKELCSDCATKAAGKEKAEKEGDKNEADQ